MSESLSPNLEPNPVETRRRRIRNLIEPCVDDPDRFNSVVLGRAPYWEKQVEVCRAIVKHRTVVVPSGNAVGKTFLAAGIILWYLYTHPGSLVIGTAPSQMLLGTVLMKEIRRAFRNSLLPLGGEISESPHTSPQTLIVDGDGWQFLGVATRGVERLSGHHNKDLLVVVDEASGVDRDICDAIRSLNPAKSIWFGNPIRSSGEFRDLHDRAMKERLHPAEEGSGCVSIPMSSLESPDIHLARSPRGLADQGFIQEIANTYGIDSLYWNSHVLGLFPDSTHDYLLKPFWVDRCAQCSRPNIAGGRRVLGVDLSAGVGRDRTVFVVRDDLGVLEIQSSRHIDLSGAAAEIHRLKRVHGLRDEDIIFDGGGVGADLPRHLEQYRILEARPFLGSLSGGSRYSNRRTKVAWQLRRRLDPNRPFPLAQLPDVDRYHLPSRPTAPAPQSQIQPPFHIPMTAEWASLREELVELKYSHIGSKTSLETKEEFGKRLGRSPDLVDALLMTFDGEEI